MFNPDQINLEAEPQKAMEVPVPVRGLESSIIKEAEILEGKLVEKSLVEKIGAEYQTKSSKINGGDIERGENTRFERGQIYKAYKILRTEIKDAEKRGENTVDKKGLLKEIRTRAKETEKNLDELETQLEKNIKVIDVETEFGKFSVPITELDLKRDLKEGEKDERTPYIFWGGIRSNAKMNGCALMALALTGQKVYMIPHLEQEKVGKPENFRETLVKQGDFKPHARITTEIIKNLGLERCNIIGYSMGAGVVLETAIELSSDPELKDLLNDLIVVEPIGLKDQSLTKLAAKFIYDGATKVSPSPEARIKIARQGLETNEGDNILAVEMGRIATKKHFTPERLGKIKATGSFQWWVGKASAVTDISLTERIVQETQNEMLEGNPSATLPELNELVGGTHGMLNMNSIGITKMFTEKRQKDEVIKVKNVQRKDLANSAMRFILEGIKRDKN